MAPLTPCLKRSSGLRRRHEACRANITAAAATAVSTSQLYATLAPCAAAARVVPLTPLTLALGVILVVALAAWGVRRAVR